ncbi:MAG TPA: UDP-N-acetylmuramoyl-L-alanine--D-glutamate ligase [Persephonella sp.]|nr:UDP-N-acetylmuramoyl-L-alanine--D-glutamate ligase [Persephonella sp.]
MKLIYGKGSTGQALVNFCEENKIDYFLMDDNNFSLSILEKVDEIIVSPGVPFYADIYKLARKRRIPIIGEIEFAYRYKKGKIIAITGTDGKSTTTKLVYDILKNFNDNTFIGGNYGIPFISFVNKLTENSITVLELSSFQIYSTKTFRPHIAVILNIDIDHLNWHKKLKHYVCSKLRITKNQTFEDYLIINKNLKNLNFKTKAKIIEINTKETEILNLERIKLKGKHNLENISVAIQISKIFNLKLEKVKEIIENFSPLEHRLEFLGTFNGVKIYNDAKSTTVQATRKAIEAIDGFIILIAGGIDKGGNFKDLRNSLNKKAKLVILIGKDKERIKKDINFKNTVFANTLEEALNIAIKYSEKEDTILFSPGCASFDMFKNYMDRGNQFKNLVNKLKAK